jgi:uncharacterized protein
LATTPVRDLLLSSLAVFITRPVQAAACQPGVYRHGPEAFVVIGLALPGAGGARRTLFLDRRRGTTGSSPSTLACGANVASVTQPDGTDQPWPLEPTQQSDSRFISAATPLTGRLIEPAGSPVPHRPLVVMVHGSEKTAALGSVYAYMLVAQGISVFVYGKRGTGASGGDYTQNFELLADDAAAALREARRLAAGCFGRAGFFGGSQGGWVAPLAATRSRADFVAIGLWLVVSSIEEDREQLLDEARQMKLGPATWPTSSNSRAQRPACSDRV